MAGTKNPIGVDPPGYTELAEHLALNRKVCLWDIDNCIADDTGRVCLIDWELAEDSRYERYNQQMWDDPFVNRHVWYLMQSMQMRPIFLTGRPQKFEGMTRIWLGEKLNIFTGEFDLFMRNGPGRPADLKKQMLHTLLTTTPVRVHHICAAFDDVPAIVEVYREFGIPSSVLCANKNHTAYTEDDLKPAGTPAQPLENA